MSDHVLQRHPVCPDCGNGWRTLPKLEDWSHTRYICIAECGFQAHYLHVSEREGYYRKVGKYHIYWSDDGTCTVECHTALPILRVKLKTSLPYDLTEDAIRMYLTFQ